MKTLAAVTALLLGASLASAQDATKAEYEGKLNNIKVTLDFQNAPLDQVVDYLREISGMNIFVDAKVRDKGLVVSLKVTEISLRSIFGLILKPQNCDILFKDGVLQLMTKEDVADRTMKMEIYDCRDILYPIQNFPGVDLDISATGSGVNLVQDPSGDQGGEIPIEEMVRTHTGGRSWECLGAGGRARGGVVDRQG